MSHIIIDVLGVDTIMEPQGGKTHLTPVPVLDFW